jgi:ABC-type transport system substrate-binding protein
LLLTDFLQAGWSAVANASHATYNMGTKKIEAMITHGVRAVMVEEHGERWVLPENMVSNGPYVLTAWEHDQSMTLERNENSTKEVAEHLGIHEKQVYALVKAGKIPASRATNPRGAKCC